MDLAKKMGPKQTVMESLLNMQLLLESDALVCTWTSNWCRLVDELRMTVAMKANRASIGCMGMAAPRLTIGNPNLSRLVVQTLTATVGSNLQQIAVVVLADS